MNRTIALGGAVVTAILALRCGPEDSQATVGLIRSGYGYVLVTPSVEPLSETSVRLSWTAPRRDVAWYDVRVSNNPAVEPLPYAAPSLAHLAPGITNVVVSGLVPGTLGQTVVAAAVLSAASVPSPSQLLWTPYGAVNEASVNSVTPLAGYGGAPYAEGMFVSANFSMFFSHAYLKEASFVFSGLPSSSTARPIYNFASPVIKYPNGFGYPDITDVTQIWSDGVSKVLVSEVYQHRVLVFNHLPLTSETAAPDLILGQATWTGIEHNNGESSVNARGFNEASGACFDGTTLYVRDSVNNRILGWRGWP